jgi:glutathione synthase/RimK-type ligase-like ATP-grasp enzyme
LTEIGLLCDQSETDELGIRLTAERLDIPIRYFPFLKSSFSFDQDSFSYKTAGRDYTKRLEDVQVILNRCQSKNRRLYASYILDSIGKKVFNPLSVEINCNSKLRTLLLFASNNINIPRTVFSSANVRETISDNGFVDNTDLITNFFEMELGSKIVIKPDAGTHGNGVRLSGSKEELKHILNSINPRITNPSGVIGQEFIDKWFFDLRIIVYKLNGEKAVCHENALARCGFKDFRTNTFLGNMVVRTKLPEKVRIDAQNCCNVLAMNEKSWVIGLDSMPSVPNYLMEEEDALRESFQELEEPFSIVLDVKNRPYKKNRFKQYTEEINNAYRDYMDTDPYRHIESVVNEILFKTAEDVCYHEGNACPEYWEQTRIVAGINVAEDLLRCATSLIDR